MILAEVSVAGLLALAGGAFAICGAYFEWEFFMQSRKAQRLISWIGYDAARMFYGAIGLIIIVLGLLMLLGVIQPK